MMLSLLHIAHHYDFTCHRNVILIKGCYTTNTYEYKIKNINAIVFFRQLRHLCRYPVCYFLKHMQIEQWNYLKMVCLSVGCG